jgi:hypothetical protein
MEIGKMVNDSSEVATEKMGSGAGKGFESSPSEILIITDQADSTTPKGSSPTTSPAEVHEGMGKDH